MPERVIRVNPPRVEPDDWQIVEDGSAELPTGALIVSLAAWTSRRAELLARAAPVGVWLKPEDDPEQLRAELPSFPVVAVHFPKAADGRGYSTAVLLRRLGYHGELRAFGDIGRDHLFFLLRCGFDAFSLPGTRDPEAALAAFGEFSLRYQGSVDDAVPLFRRRGVAGSVA